MLKTAPRLLFFALILSISAFAQDTEPAIDEHVCNDDFAKLLVDQQVAESRSVVETDKRVRILTKSADFLWKFDQPRAREYFAEAYKVATERFKEKGFERVEYGRGNISVQLPDYRLEVLRAIARHDGAWARKLTDEILKEMEADAANRKERDQGQEIGSLMHLAQENIKTNPALSWFLYRRLMRQDVDFHWLMQLFGAAGKDPAFADALYGELIASHANATPRQVLYLSAYPFARDRMFGYGRSQYILNIPEGLTPKPQLQARFIDLMLRRSDAFASDPANFNLPPGDSWLPSEGAYIVTALRELQPIVIQTFPAMLPRLNSALAKGMSLLSESDRKKISDLDNKRSDFGPSFEERIEELEKADSEGKLTDAMILRALISGLKTEEQFKILEPWLDKMTDPEGRAGSMHYFWFKRSQLATKEKRFADAQKFAVKVPELEHQAILWFEIAEKQLADINDSATAYQTLADVGKVARRAEDSVGKAQVLLGLANLYEKLNHSFAISELSDAVTVINKVKDADLQSKYLLRYIQVKDMSFGASFSTPGYDLETTFSALSKTDFSLPLSNARTIDDKYYRTIAVIAIAKNCIDRPKPKSAGVRSQK
jgi:hypothetical protein